MATLHTVHFNKKGFTHSPYTESKPVKGFIVYDNSKTPDSGPCTIPLNAPLEASSPSDENNHLLIVDQTGSFEDPNILFTLNNGESREVNLQKFFRQLDEKSEIDNAYSIDNSDFADLARRDYVAFFKSELEGFIEGNDAFFEALTHWIENAVGIEQHFAALFSSADIDAVDLS